MRLLVPIRVSRDVEEGSSPSDQRDVALVYADTHPGTKIIFTDVIDYDISGATPIAERAGVKDWLQPDKINEWDAIGGSEMTRLSRDIYDYLGFFRNLIDARGKIIVDLSDGTDSTTLRGRQVLEDRVIQGQRYREFVGEKRARKSDRLSDLGQWDGGPVPFGYRTVQRKFLDDFDRERTGWFLIKDTGGTALIAERMIDCVFSGMSNQAIAREFNAEVILGRKWSESGVQYKLHSPALAGFMVKMEGKSKHIQTIRRDRDGQPIRFTDDPIISEERWQELQDLLKSRSRHPGQTHSAHVLWNVVFCRNCSQPCEDELPCSEHDVKIYGARRATYVERGNNYCCKRCGYTINLEYIERYIEWRLLKGLGQRLVMEPRTIRGSEYSADIIKLERRIERWRMDLDAEYDEDLARLIEKNEAKLAELMEGPHEPDRIELRAVEPPITIAEYWASLKTPKERNQYLRTTGTVFYADEQGIEGQFGWMEMDDPSIQFEGLRKMLRMLKGRTVTTWYEASEQMSADGIELVTRTFRDLKYPRIAVASPSKR
jgi:DNA invertase Pin-like site-specific DNA recombinase